MKLDPINLIGGFYQDDNLPWSAQDTVNWIPRPAEMPGTISQMKLVGAPGLSFLADIDDDPVRVGGFRNVEGRMFIVAGTTLYELNTDLTTTVRGTIPGAGPVTMAHNQLEFGNELCIGNGSGTLYVWNTFTNTFTTVTDDAATGSVQSVYLNRRIIHLDPFGRFGYPSEIDSATSYDSLDRFDSEASPDKFVGLGVSQFELVGISQRTTEFYSDTGATEQPFRPKRIAINRGCAARNSIVQLGGTLAMLGDDGIFYRLQGYQWEPISTGPVNKAIEGNNWANCFGFVYEDRKHEIAYWTFPDGQTWGYDAWTGLIHRRESFGFNRWRINAIEKWNDMWIAGDFQRGRIYAIEWGAYHEAGQPLVARRVAPPIYNNGNSVVCPMIELVFDTGRGGLPEAPPVVLSGNLPDGFTGEVVSYQYTASGGTQPYSFSLAPGSNPLPAGLVLTETGEVTGTRTTLGTYPFVVRVTDAFGQTDDLNDTSETAQSPQNQFEIVPYTGNGAANRIIGTINMTGGGLTLLFRDNGYEKSEMGTGASVYDFNTGTNASSLASNPQYTSAGINRTSTGSTNANGINYRQYLVASSYGVQVVPYSGNGAARTIAHTLGVAPGCIFVCRVGAGIADNLYHRSAGAGISGAFGDPSTSELVNTVRWNNTAPTPTVFSVGADADINAIGSNYLAFLFSHQTDLLGKIYCGSYTGNGSVTGPTVNIGWTPRALIILPSSRSLGNPGPSMLFVDLVTPTGDERRALGQQGGSSFTNGDLVTPNSSGFQVIVTSNQLNAPGNNYRFIAFR